MRAKISIGYYMSSPALGGAENYLRQLLWGIDRDKFQVTLYLAAWPDFERFLGVGKCEGLDYFPLPIGEPGTQGTSRCVTARNERAGRHPAHGTTAMPSRFQTFYWRMGGPFRPIVDGYLYPVLRDLRLIPDTWHLRNAFRAKTPDILHVVNGGYPGATSARAATFVGKKVGIPVSILTVCSTAMPRRRFLRPVEQRIDQRVVSAVDHVIVPAERPGNALVTNRGFVRDQLTEIPWGISAPIPPTKRDHARHMARQQLGIPQDSPVVGTLSRIVPEKGHIVLAEATSLLNDEIPSLITVLAGDGPERAQLEGKIRTLPNSRRIEMPGAVEDKFALLRACDVFVLASDIEGLPYVVLEALSQGVPVIATNVGGMNAAVIEGRTGFLVPPRDPRALANRIKTMLNNPSMLDRMSLAALELHTARFTLEAMLRKHEALYESVAPLGRDA